VGIRGGEGVVGWEVGLSLVMVQEGIVRGRILRSGDRRGRASGGICWRLDIVGRGEAVGVNADSRGGIVGVGSREVEAGGVKGVENAG